MGKEDESFGERERERGLIVKPRSYVNFVVLLCCPFTFLFHTSSSMAFD
jgi:hypothetical protein